MSGPWQPDDPMPEPTTAWDHLRYVQRQLDQDGVEVGVSRQAIDETLTEFDRLTADNERLRAALEKIVRECVWLPVGAGDGDTYVVTTPSAASEALPAPPESEPK